MNKLTLALAAVAGAMLLFSCTSQEGKFLKEAEKMYSQAEDKVKDAADMDSFFDALAQFQDQKNAFAQEMMAAYSEDGENAMVPNELIEAISERANAYNEVEAQKFAELFTPYLEAWESAADKLLAAYEDPDTTEAQWDALAGQYEEAFENVMDFAEYDNVLPELKERCEAVLAKMQVLMD